MNHFEKNTHRVSIRTRMNKTVPEIIRWGEASWWPRDSFMRFTRTTAFGEVQKGTRYKQTVLLPFAPSWNVEVDRVTDSAITRVFLDGMFTGFETVSAKQEGLDVVVTYEMCYGLNGAVNKILWSLVFRRMHDANIEAILKNLKNYLETKWPV